MNLLFKFKFLEKSQSFSKDIKPFGSVIGDRGKHHPLTSTFEGLKYKALPKGLTEADYLVFRL